MLARLATRIPIAPIDALFVRALAATSPRITAAACEPGCDFPRKSGLCSCSNGCWADRFVDDCTGAFCYCDDCPSPPC